MKRKAFLASAVVAVASMFGVGIKETSAAPNVPTPAPTYTPGKYAPQHCMQIDPNTIEGSQFRIIPGFYPGHPTTGAHLAGEIYLDSSVIPWLCVREGTPGTWIKWL